MDVLKTHLIAEGRLSDAHIHFILNGATEILRAEETLLDVEAPLTGTAIVRHQTSHQPFLAQFAGTSTVSFTTS